MATKFTFKTEQPTGKYKGFFSKINYIKLNKKQCGVIEDEEPHRISLSIKREITEKDPAPFKWVILKREFSSVDEAKTFLNENFEKITRQLDLHLFDNN